MKGALASVECSTCLQRKEEQSTSEPPQRFYGYSHSLSKAAKALLCSEKKTAKRYEQLQATPNIGPAAAVNLADQHSPMVSAGQCIGTADTITR